MLTLADHAVFVAEVEEEVVGWLHVQGRELLESDRFAEITGLVVDQLHRGKGLGKSLLRAAEAWAREHGFKTMRVRSNVIRVDTHRFYEGAGYRVIETQKAFLREI